MSTDPTITDTAAALAFAEEHTLTDTIDLGNDRILVRYRERSASSMTFVDSWKEHSTRDPLKLPDPPDRLAGTTAVYDTTSYVDAVHRYQTPDQITYVDQPGNNVVTVLNPNVSDYLTGPADHRVALTLRHTPEFEAWKSGQGLVDQEAFARRMQDGEAEIQSPSPSLMLEIAETFHATGESKFKSAKRLQDGRRQFVFEEDTSAKAGADGTVEIPETFTIVTPIYVGGDPYTITCRLVWRLRPEFRIGYSFVRIDSVINHAFASMAGQITGQIEGLVLNAPVPR